MIILMRGNDGRIKQETGDGKGQKGRGQSGGEVGEGEGVSRWRERAGL